MKRKLDQYGERALIEMFFEDKEEAVLQTNQISDFLKERNNTLEQMHHEKGLQEAKR